MTVWSYSFLLPYWIVCLFEHTHYILLCISPWIHHTSLHHIIPIQMIPKTAHHSKHSMYSLQHIIPIQQVPATVCLIDHTHCSGLTRLLEHTEWTTLQKYINNPGAQDWSEMRGHRVHKTSHIIEHTQRTLDWPETRTHTMHKIG